MASIREDLQDELNEVLKKYNTIKEESDTLSKNLTELDFKLSDPKLKPMLNEIVKYKKDSILHHLKMTLRLKNDEKLQTILKEIEKKQGIMIFGTEKSNFFKILQNYMNKLKKNYYQLMRTPSSNLKHRSKTSPPLKTIIKTQGKES